MPGTNNNTTRRALLVGINKYPKLAQRFQLDGCVNDVELMAGILQNNFGFPKANITVLTDEEATRDGVLDAMDALTESTHENDIVVIHYSGHGSRIRDREGDEPDGWDETIVPTDSGRGVDNCFHSCCDVGPACGGRRDADGAAGRRVGRGRRPGRAACEPVRARQSSRCLH